MAPADRTDETEEAWSRLLSGTSIEAAKLLRQSPFDRSRRTYVADDRVYKVAIPEPANPDDVRALDLAGEYAVLQQLSGTQGVAVALNYSRHDGVEILCLKRIDGKPLTQIEGGWFSMGVIWARVSLVILRVAWRGISHNDISEDNILVSHDSRVSLIDFDQATRTSFLAAALRGFPGVAVGSGVVCGSIRSTIGQFRRRCANNGT